MDKRLLDSGEIKTVWNQVSMKPLSNAMFRFAGEIAIAQLAKVDSLISEKDDKRRPWFEQSGASNTYTGRLNRAIP